MAVCEVCWSRGPSILGRGREESWGSLGYKSKVQGFWLHSSKPGKDCWGINQGGRQGPESPWGQRHGNSSALNSKRKWKVTEEFYNNQTVTLKLLCLLCLLENIHCSGKKGKTTTQELTRVFPAVCSRSRNCSVRQVEVSWEGGACRPCPELSSLWKVRRISLR